jgi:hypothetical protein
MSGQPTEARNQVTMKLRIKAVFEFPPMVISHGQQDLNQLHYSSRLARVLLQIQILTGTNDRDAVT